MFLCPVEWFLFKFFNMHSMCQYVTICLLFPLHSVYLSNNNTAALCKLILCRTCLIALYSNQSTRPICKIPCTQTSALSSLISNIIYASKCWKQLMLELSWKGFLYEWKSKCHYITMSRMQCNQIFIKDMKNKTSWTWVDFVPNLCPDKWCH